MFCRRALSCALSKFRAWSRNNAGRARFRYAVRCSNSERHPVAKNQNTFEKRRREIEKKQRAEEKRKRRQQRKDQPEDAETRRRYGEPDIE